MNNPACDKCGSEALYKDMGSMITLMYDPVLYDQDGKPKAGGCNIKTSGVMCVKCGQLWVSKQTELQDALGVERKWELK